MGLQYGYTVGLSSKRSGEYMGFFDKAFKLAKDTGVVIANSIAEKATEISTTRSKYEQKSDSELLRIIHSGSGLFSNSKTEKAVAFKLLTERGYSREEIMKRPS